MRRQDFLCWFFTASSSPVALCFCGKPSWLPVCSVARAKYFLSYHIVPRFETTLYKYLYYYYYYYYSLDCFQKVLRQRRHWLVDELAAFLDKLWCHGLDGAESTPTDAGLLCTQLLHLVWILSATTNSPCPTHSVNIQFRQSISFWTDK